MGYDVFSVEFPAVPKMGLKLVTLGHLLLVSWATLSAWAGQALLVHNLFFILCLLWMIHSQESDDAAFLGLGINVISILLDIIILSVFYPSELSSSTSKFSAVMAIFNLLLRLVSSHIVYTEWTDRGGAKPRIVPPTIDTSAGAVRSGSVLTHYPGRFEVPVSLSPPSQKDELPPLPPSYTQVN